MTQPPRVRLRLVFDASALLPMCLHPERAPALAFRQALLQHSVYASESTLTELGEVVMRPKFDAWQPCIYRQAWLTLFQASVEVVVPTEAVTDCRDPKDNQYLELALAAKADALVSSDDDLLALHPYRGINIWRLADFQARMGA